MSSVLPRDVGQGFKPGRSLCFDSLAGNPPAIKPDSLWLEGFEFEDSLEVDLSLSDGLLAVDNTGLGEGARTIEAAEKRNANEV